MPQNIDQIIANAQMLVEFLSSTARQELEKLFSEQQMVITLQSNLALAMERYHLEHSIITQVANWYGSKTWLERGGLFLCVLVVSGLIGAVSSAITACMTICSALFILTAYILDDHYTITAHRDGAFAEEITALEHQLTASVQAMNDYVTLIKSLCEQLGSHNLSTLQMLQDIHTEHMQLKQYMLEFKESVACFEALRIQIIQDHRESIQKRNHTNTRLDTVSQQLLSMITQLQHCITLMQRIHGSHIKTHLYEEALEVSHDTKELSARHQQCLESARILIQQRWLNKGAPWLSDTLPPQNALNMDQIMHLNLTL